MVLDMDRRYLGAAALLVLLLVFAGGMKYGDMRNQNQNKKEIISDSVASEQEVSKSKKEDIIQVYVTGAVEKPGVYRLQTGARAYEAIDMARALPTANLKNINLAQKIEDGQPIVVPALGEEPPVSVPSSGLTLGPASSKPGSAGRVDINSASAQDLDGLPGIGPTLAQRIIEYRNSHGAFARIEDINEVSGIGDKKFTDIKDLITVR
ncbi:MAG: competence protein ComEA [Firmicutes bacterium HGW-Firmicutes-15]|nr:MAG: competence protein ComEA [Firmicutes bacterium HGW-Firmicutes-15]